MNNRQSNSSSDRRWARRFQRIQERKESAFDYENCRKERREQRRKEARDYYVSYGFDPTLMCSEKVAVACHSYSELRALIHETRKKFSEYVPPDRDLAKILWNDSMGETVVGICNSEYWFFDEIKELKDYGRVWFLSHGYDVVDFYDCCKAKDLGRITTCGDLDNLLR